MSIMTSNSYHENKNLSVESLTTGLYDFDKIQGIGIDDFVVLAGGTGSGKSTLALFIACNIAKSGKKVLYVNLENSQAVIAKKISFFGFDFDRDFGIIGKDGEPEFLKILNKSSIKYDEILNAIKLLGISVLFLDLFSCLQTGAQCKDISVMGEKYATEFSHFPEKYKCAVIVTEQLTKDSHRFKRPTEHDIKGASALSHKATKIITIYQHKKSNMDKFFIESNGDYTRKDIGDIVSELIVRKDRHDRLISRIYPVKFECGGFKQLTTNDNIEYWDLLKGVKK